MNISILINRLMDYAEDACLTLPEDRSFFINRIISLLGLDSIEECEYEKAEAPLSEILSGILDFAGEKGIIDSSSVTERDLFDTKIMGELTPTPRETREKFSALYESSRKAATD